MIEIWKDIEGYDGAYQISNFGRVYSNKRNKVLKPSKGEKGYLTVWLSNKGKGNHIKIHRLVAAAFIPNPDNLPQINHKDEDKTNNHVGNLEYCDNRYNTIYSISHRKPRKIQ